MGRDRSRGFQGNRGRPSGRKRHRSNSGQRHRSNSSQQHRSNSSQRLRPAAEPGQRQDGPGPGSSKRRKKSAGNSTRFQRGGLNPRLPRYPGRQPGADRHHPSQSRTESNSTHPQGIGHELAGSQTRQGPNSTHPQGIGHELAGSQTRRGPNSTHPQGISNELAGSQTRRGPNSTHPQGIGHELAGSQTRRGPNDRPRDDPITKFLQKTRDISIDVAPDTLCMFLAQHQRDLARVLMDPRWQNREVAEKLLAMVRRALTESSPLCSRSGQQVMAKLQSTGFFESGLAVAVAKSLVTTKHRSPDKSDTIVVDNMLATMSKMIDAGLLSTEDTIVFIGSVQVALRTGASGREDMLDLKKKVLDVERKAGHSHADVTSCHGTMYADDDPLGPILPDITKICITDLQPRNFLETFSSAAEYVRYMFQVYREDFIGPLYKGVQDYTYYVESCRRKSGRDKPKFRNQTVRLYENVQIIDTALSNDTDIDATIRIDTGSSRFRNFNSRLIHGSLVCLSCDHFQNVVIYATVSDRDSLETQGLLNINIVHEEHGFRDDDSDVEYMTGRDGCRQDQTGSDRIRQDQHQGNKDREDGVLTRIVNSFLHPTTSEVSQHRETRGLTKFSMLESTAFYAPYMHTLQSLKALYSRVSGRQHSLPFKRQLLELSKERRAPRCHEASDGHVTFACMMKYAKKAIEAGIAAVRDNSVHEEAGVARKQQLSIPSPEYAPPSDEDYSSSPEHSPTPPSPWSNVLQSLVWLGTYGQELAEKERKEESVKRKKEALLRKLYVDNVIGDPSTWPSAELLGLDDSQYSALNMALTHNVALIQGPPGTGKTLLGVRIAELLLENQHLWRTDEHDIMDKAPLLVLSYTNHALDQFLTAILRKPCAGRYAISDVVRVGSRCDQDILAVHNIARLRKMRDNPLENERILLEQLRISRRSMDMCLERSKRNIIHASSLFERQVVLECHSESLSHGNDASPALLRWLCLDSEDLGCSLDKTKCYIHCFQDNGRKFTVKTEKTQSRKHKRESINVPSKRPVPLPAPDLEDGELRDSDDTVDMKDNEVAHDVDPYDVDSCEQEQDMEEEYKRRLDLEEDLDDISHPASDDKPSTSCDAHLTPSQTSSGETMLQDMEWLALFTDTAQLEFYDVTALQSTLFKNTPLDESPVRKKIEREANSDDLMTAEEEQSVRDPWHLDATQRWRLYRLWLHRVRDQIRRMREKGEDLFKLIAKRVEELRSLTDLDIMRQARVVGMTTTGASRYSAVLHQLGSRVVIVEEAAQVPEAHVVSALSPACDHLIMIGDHKQLRPSYNNYSLTLRRGRHFIDISLFERLCRAGLPFSCLALQHRMRPEISRLLVPTIYDHLKDDTSVLEFPSVRGVKANMFFLNHSHTESSTEESKSKRNTHEAEFLKSLYRYLRLQGYSDKDITVLALYKDQVILLQSLIKKVEQEDPLIKHHHQKTCPPDDNIPRRGKWQKAKPRPTGARVTAVDNFQGEESKLVLLSLVRSNKDGQIGYLREDNRVCVALSRAKQGLYVVGNCTMLAEKSPKCWKPILQMAQDSLCLGESLPLHCSRHDVITPVATSADIDRCRNGGCTARCGVRKHCGHSCDEVCHDPELFHYDRCTKPCARQCSFGHRCTSSCGDVPCPPCGEKCTRKCGYGHPCDKLCGQSCAPCGSGCEKTLSCGHQCQSECGQPCTDQCKELVKAKGVCGHEFQTDCGQKKIARCTVPCSSILNCGHPCSGKCGTCFAGRLHVSCKRDCQRVLVCGHTCAAKCAKSCPPCQEDCRSVCMHSACRKKCGETCIPCVDKCEWRCKKHCQNKFRCNKLCSELCDRMRCDEPCRSQHSCGQCKQKYKCRGLFCESECPPACPSCNKDIFDIFFGTEEEPDARFYQMPDCPCVLELTGLDHYMDSESDSVGNRTCPKCKSPILTAQRYKRELKKTGDIVGKVKAILVKEMNKDDTGLKVIQSVLKLVLKNDDFYPSVNTASLTTDLRRLAKQANRHLNLLTGWTREKRLFFSDQQLGEFQRELSRADIMFCLLAAQHRMTTLAAPEKEKERILEMLQKFTDRVLKDMKVLSLEVENNIRKAIKEANSLSGVGVSDEERLMILTTMDFSKGHWYKCKNGHVYCIGECGGAMEESVCPECKEKIGGGQHRLTDGNSVATEMDGAVYGAWSEQANLENYEGIQ